jgi:hypothetical protein
MSDEIAALLVWAVAKWNYEVANRPLINVHRRSLDDTWRQVITKLGGNADELVGESHDNLVANAGCLACNASKVGCPECD